MIEIGFGVGNQIFYRILIAVSCLGISVMTKWRRQLDDLTSAVVTYNPQKVQRRRNGDRNLSDSGSAAARSRRDDVRGKRSAEMSLIKCLLLQLAVLPLPTSRSSLPPLFYGTPTPSVKRIGWGWAGGRQALAHSCTSRKGKLKVETVNITSHLFPTTFNTVDDMRKMQEGKRKGREEKRRREQMSRAEGKQTKVKEKKGKNTWKMYTTKVTQM